MANMMKLMKQAADMQKNMAKMQAELAEKEVTFSSGGGAVSVTAKGDGSVTAIKIAPAAVTPDDVEMLEDLVLAAVQGALDEAKETAANEMQKLTAGLNLPPGFGF